MVVNSKGVARAQLQELADLAAAVAGSPLSGELEHVAALVVGALREGSSLFFCGNGGSTADAQHLAVSLERGPRVMGGYLERVRRNEDEYYARYGNLYGFRGHDLEWTFGLQGLEPVGPLQLQWQGGISRRKNRSFIGLDGINWAFRRETNAELTLTAWWLPGR